MRLTEEKIDLDQTLKVMAQYVANRLASDPFSEDSLRGQHMTAILKSVSMADISFDEPMVTHAIAWAGARSLIVLRETT